MCCLRYEHEFYVQSRKRFPKEGKIVATSLGEEKVVSVDIFRERITLRGVEGETRLVTLKEFKEETEQASDGHVVANLDVEEDFTPDTIRPDEISPELMYTAEHQVLTIPANVALRPPVDESKADADGPGRRRRGRRGGRRGRGEDSQSGNQ
jgi:hypothetical protein